jgi:hypothetical protein
MIKKKGVAKFHISAQYENKYFQMDEYNIDS